MVKVLGNVNYVISLIVKHLL